MGEYSVGVATKNKIYTVSKRLFYEKGIKGTSYADICREAEVNRGLIPYYFKSKTNLASHVFSDFVTGMGEAVDSTFGSDAVDPRVKNALIELLQFGLLDQNEHVLRFYGEAMASPEFHEQQFAVQADVLSRLLEGVEKRPTEAALRTLTCMMHGTENELVQAMRAGYLTEGVDDFVRRDVVWIYRMLGFTDEETNQSFQRGLELRDGYRLVCDEQFRCGLVKDE